MNWKILLVGTVVVGAVVLGVTISDDFNGHEAGSYLDVDLLGENESVDRPVIAYSNLTPAQQRVFEQALADDDIYPIPSDVNATVFYEHGGIRYQNQTYRIGVAVS